MERKKRIKSEVYTKEALKQALQDIRENNIPIRKASKKYKIPRTTLLDRANKQSFDEFLKPGPTPVLGTDGEKEVVKWLIHISKCGFQIKRTEILDTAQQIINESMIPNKFKNGRPGRTWYDAFLNRNPEIATLQKQIHKTAKAKATQESLRLWFYELEAFLEHRNLSHILERPKNIFNLDEATFVFNPDTEEILGPKTLRNLYKLKTGTEEDLTVLVTTNTNGDLCPPCISFPYNLPPSKVLENMPQDWCLGNSDSDQMKSFVFFEYITNCFNNWIESNKIEKPVLLLVNQQKSQLSLTLCAVCEELQIILYAIPENASHIIRPTDAGIFLPLQKNWNKIVKEFLDRSECLESSITKKNFCKFLQDTWQDADLAANLRREFEKCGLYPFEDEALDYSKCLEKPI